MLICLETLRTSVTKLTLIPESQCPFLAMNTQHLSLCSCILLQGFFDYHHVPNVVVGASGDLKDMIYDLQEVIAQWGGRSYTQQTIREKLLKMAYK